MCQPSFVTAGKHHQQSHQCVLTLGVSGGALQPGLLLEKTRGPRNWRKKEQVNEFDDTDDTWMCRTEEELM